VNSYLAAFLVGGLICALGQVIIDCTKLTQGHVLSMFTVAGGILSGLGLYERLIEFAGAGATLPISSFGNALTQGAIREAERSGTLGLLTGMFELTSSGIAAAIMISFLAALLFSPRS
jgi:stage V sporulation protein AE